MSGGARIVGDRDPVAGAARRWREALHGWAIPAEILDAAPQDPYAFPAGVLTEATVDPRSTPTGQRVLEVLHPEETLLDVGCGAGRISAPFVDTHRIVGVEPRPGLAAIASERGIEVHHGRWPDLADAVGMAPVTLCTHVLYDVDDPGPFLAALDLAAQRRVVIEVTNTHPWSWITPLYRRFHDLDRPAGPTAAMLLDVIYDELGVVAEITSWSRPRHRYAHAEDLTAHARQMLCPPASRDSEITEALRGEVQVGPDGFVALPDQDLATIWWNLDG